MMKSDPPELHNSGRMAGTGTAVAGTGTRDVGCQLRWRFLGGPDDIEDAASKSAGRNMLVIIKVHSVFHDAFDEFDLEWYASGSRAARFWSFFCLK